MSKQNNKTQQFNSQILQSVHDLLTDPELQHIDKDDLMYYITTEIRYRCEEAVYLIEERHADSLEYDEKTQAGK